MNSTDTSHYLPGYKRAVTGMALLLLIFLALVNFILIKSERQAYLKNVQDNSRFELEQTAMLLVEPLLKNQFSDIDRFVQSWAESHREVTRFEAITPKGYVLSSFQRETQSPFLITIEKEVTHQNQHLLTLRLTKVYGEVEHILAKTRTTLLTASLLIVGGLGISLWMIFRRLAIQPLEQEVARRVQAETELAAANSDLDDKVRQRTRELSAKNQALVKEIANREAIENLLEAERERLLVTLRSIGDGVITTHTDGTVVLLNKVAEALTGWRQDEAIGRPLSEVFRIINALNREPCESPVEKVIETGHIIGLANHTLLLSKDGQERLIADSGAPIRDRDSMTIGVVLVFRDITEQQRTEQELIKIKKLESVGILAGGIAHDFNNILAAILGNINLALNDKTIHTKTRNLLTDAERASLRAKDLTQQLLTFAKGGEPVRETASLERVIKDSANFVLHGDSVACRFDIPSDLWLANIDTGQISQVIQNIVLNASHAMPEGGTISIRAENVTSTSQAPYPLLAEGAYIKLSFKDSGIGIPAKFVDKIFDPYFSTKHGGSGLGLAISQSIVRKHGGHILVSSNPETGTTFTIYLPAAGEALKADPEAESLELKTVRAKILVMDDEEMVKQVAKGMLAELGHEALFAADGAEALRLYREMKASAHPVDLLIVDLTVPGGMGGRDTITEILKIDPNAKAIVASGYSTDPVMANYAEYGFCGALMKPFQLQDLSKVIQRALA